MLICVAALGFGDIPPEAFMAAFEQVTEGGWVAFCIKDEFISEEDRSGFSKLDGGRTLGFEDQKKSGRTAGASGSQGNSNVGFVLNWKVGLVLNWISFMAAVRR